jgi:hypothetical protein
MHNNEQRQIWQHFSLGKFLGNFLLVMPAAFWFDVWVLNKQWVIRSMANATADNQVFTEMGSRIAELRGALTELLVSTDVANQKPLVMSRTLGVDKNLAWKVSKLVKSTEAAAAFQHLPGEAGLEIFLDAVTRRGAPVRSTDRVRSALKAIYRSIEQHVGDRQTLDILLDGMSDRSEERLLASRKLAFRGTSGIWGVQAKTRINTAIIAPSATSPEMVDQVSIGGWIDFRRLRTNARWALFRKSSLADSSPMDLHRSQPIDLAAEATGPMFIRDFCSDGIPPVEVVSEPNGVLVYELSPTAVGNTGAFTCFFGSILRNIGSQFAEEPDDHGEFAAVISAPVEHLQFDLLAHQSLDFALDTSVAVYGNNNYAHGEWRERDRLPLDMARRSLGRPPIIDSPVMARYPELIQYVMQRVSWNVNEFTALRFTLEFPPFPSTVLIRFPLDRQRIQKPA